MSYRIQFSKKAAFLLDYDDSEGQLTFVFERKPPKIVLLHVPPLLNSKRLITLDPTAIKRVDLAFERAKNFLIEQGYEVVRFDE